MPEIYPRHRKPQHETAESYDLFLLNVWYNPIYERDTFEFVGQQIRSSKGDFVCINSQHHIK